MDEHQKCELFCKPTIERIEGYCKKIFNILEGRDGEDGLVVKVARQDERIKSIQRWRTWAIGLGTTVIASIIVAFVVFFTTHK